MNHRTGDGFLVGQALELNLRECFTVGAGEDSLTQGGILHAPRIDIQTAGVEAGTLTQFGPGHVLHLGVNGGGVRADSVNLVVLEGSARSTGLHLGEDNLVQQGLGAPPLVIGHHTEGLRGGIPALVSQGEGTSPVLGVGRIHKAVIEELDVLQSGVQNHREEAL